MAYVLVYDILRIEKRFSGNSFPTILNIGMEFGNSEISLLCKVEMHVNLLFFEHKAAMVSQLTC